MRRSTTVNDPYHQPSGGSGGGNGNGITPPRVSYRPAGESDEDWSESDEDYSYNAGPRRRNPPLLANLAAEVGGVGGGGGGDSVVSPARNDTTNNNGWGSSSFQPRSPPTPVTPPKERVRIACEEGNVDKVREFLASKVLSDINAYLPNNSTPLNTAAANAHPHLVAFLLENGADPKKFSYTRKITPLMAAVGAPPENDESDVLECCKLIVEKLERLDEEEEKLKKSQVLEEGVDNLFPILSAVNPKKTINVQDTQAKSALVVAVKHQAEHKKGASGRRKVLEYLLEKGADPDVQDFSGRTPLFYAAELGDGKTCRLLLEKGANVHHVDDDGWSAEEVAKEKEFHSLGLLLHIARTTKWRPGDDPSLMDQMVDIKRRPEMSEIKEDTQIDLVLRSIDAGKFSENFRKHQVSYIHFLQLEDGDLKDIGIEEVGMRKKILEAINDAHKAEWTTNSVRSVAINKKVTATDVVCIFNNAKMHIEHIANTIEVLRKRVLKEPETLKYGKEKNRIPDILKLLKKMSKNNFQMEKEVCRITNVLKKLKDNPDYKVGDYFEEVDEEKLLKKWISDTKVDDKTHDDNATWSLKKKVLVTGCAMGFGYALYKVVARSQ